MRRDVFIGYYLHKILYVIFPTSLPNLNKIDVLKLHLKNYIITGPSKRKATKPFCQIDKEIKKLIILSTNSAPALPSI